jgi:hypothetical protein
MAMFYFDYKLINSLNTFNYLSKDRYLSWKDKQSIIRTVKSCSSSDVLRVKFRENLSLFILSQRDILYFREYNLFFNIKNKI